LNTGTTQIAIARSAVVATSALLALTGCSSSGNGSSSASTAGTAGGSTTATAAQGSGTGVTVDETEYSLNVSQSSFAPGTYTFTAKNQGKISHALAITGPGVPTAKTSVISPGSTAQLKVTLLAGTYELWCPVDGHKDLGMDSHIQVGGTSTATPTSSAGSSSGSGGGY
jgi:uncharacterized cupredoxin-like copper-binding protein